MQYPSAKIASILRIWTVLGMHELFRPSSREIEGTAPRPCGKEDSNEDSFEKPQKVYPADHPEPRISCQSNHPLAVTAEKPFRASGARRVHCAKTPVCSEVRGHDRLRRILSRYRPRRTAKI